jgi:hypothetical protein
MPGGLDSTVKFIRVFPWRWVGKKGSCDVSATALNAKWHYNWNISLNSPVDWEYSAIKQQPFWPSLNQNWQTRGVNHLLGFNEPDNPVEDAYKNLSPPGSVADAVARWPELLGTGLRVGAPAVTDGGTNWITDFMGRANAAGHRVDYVPVHYYRSFANNNDPQGAANQMFNFLKNIYDRVQRPIWVTEFNNGANWTNDAHDPSVAQNRNVVQAMIQMMDNTPWIERYAIYSRVEWFRQTHYDDGSLTPMGTMYRDHRAPMAHVQVVPNTGSSGNALYSFEGNVRDSLSGNNPVVYGTPKLVPGRHGQALSFDGTDDWLSLPGILGDSNNFSFSAWVRWEGGDNWQRIFDLGNGTSHSLYLTPKSADNTLRFGLRVGDTQQTLNGPSLTPRQWTHVAVTHSGNTGKLFVNGVLVNTNANMTLRASQVGTELNYLGKSQWASNPLFAGSLDEVRFFNTGLSDAEVLALATLSPPEFVASPSLGEATIDLPFTGDLSSLIASSGGPVTFGKLDGPAWLTVSANGAVFGVPGLADVGTAELMVTASAGGALSTVSLPIPVRGGEPLLRFPFDGSAQSAVGRAHAVLAGGPGYATGRTGQALNLDGVDDHALLPQGSVQSDSITVATWVFWNGGAQWQRLFDFGNGTGSYFFLTPRSGGNTMRVALRNGGAEQSFETAQLATGVWTHVAVTLGEGVGRLFVNGVQVSSSSAISIRPSEIRPVLNYLGRSQFAADPYFNGRIDDFQVIGRALAAVEVEALRTQAPPVIAASPLVLPSASVGEVFEANISSNAAGAGVRFFKSGGPAWLVVEENGRISGVPGHEDAGDLPLRVRAVSAGSPVLATDFEVRVPVRPPSGLRAHYSFDGRVTDGAGSFHGTAFNSPGFTGGLFDGALALDGVDDYVQLPAAAVSGLTDATFAVRFRWNGGSNWQRVFDFGTNTSRYFFLTPRSSSGTLRFSITLGGSSSEQLIETAPPATGEWTHVAVVLQGNTGTLYVNGHPAASSTVTLDPADIAPTLNYLGKSQWPDPYFNGAIDDFRIYDRALTATQVRDLAVPPPAVNVLPSAAGYEGWAKGFEFAAGRGGPGDDADGDGLSNVLEWLFGTDPTNGSSRVMPAGRQLSAADVKRQDGKSYLALRARIRKDRPGVTLIPEAAATPGGLGTPESAARVSLAGPPVDDGDFEVFTWYHETPMEDAARGFMRLRVVYE